MLPGPRSPAGRLRAAGYPDCRRGGEPAGGALAAAGPPGATPGAGDHDRRIRGERAGLPVARPAGAGGRGVSGADAGAGYPGALGPWGSAGGLAQSVVPAGGRELDAVRPGRLPALAHGRGPGELAADPGGRHGPAGGCALPHPALGSCPLAGRPRGAGAVYGGSGRRGAVWRGPDPGGGRPGAGPGRGGLGGRTAPAGAFPALHPRRPGRP